MKTLLILLTCFGLTAVAWAEMHEGKHHSGKMMFEKMDTNKDGTISVEEHEAGLNKMQERRREHFSKMDTNGDGLVTKEEANGFGMRRGVALIDSIAFTRRLKREPRTPGEGGPTREDPPRMYHHDETPAMTMLFDYS